MKRKSWAEKIYEAGKIMGTKKTQGTKNYKDFKQKIIDPKIDDKDFKEAFK